jgi:hypothetical protein
MKGETLRFAARAAVVMGYDYMSVRSELKPGGPYT